MPADQAGTVALAAAGAKDLVAGDIARQATSAASKLEQEAPACAFATKADVGIGVRVVALHVRVVLLARLTMKGGRNCRIVPDSRAAVRVGLGVREAESRSKRWLLTSKHLSR